MRLATTYLTLLVLLVTAAACDKVELYLPDNNRTKIQGEWNQLEMGFPTEPVYDFDQGVIRIDGIESGSFQFETNELVEITLDNRPRQYQLEFPDERSMIWYREVGDDWRKASEWRRVRR